MPSMDMGDDVTTPVNSILDSILDGLKPIGSFLLRVVMRAVRPSPYKEEIRCYDHYQY